MRMPTGTRRESHFAFSILLSRGIDILLSRGGHYLFLIQITVGYCATAVLRKSNVVSNPERLNFQIKPCF